jgi:hypothetical protein
VVDSLKHTLFLERMRVKLRVKYRNDDVPLVEVSSSVPEIGLIHLMSLPRIHHDRSPRTPLIYSDIH